MPVPLINLRLPAAGVQRAYTAVWARMSAVYSRYGEHERLKNAELTDRDISYVQARHARTSSLMRMLYDVVGTVTR